jgi:hypothetical protein
MRQLEKTLQGLSFIRILGIRRNDKVCVGDTNFHYLVVPPKKQTNKKPKKPTNWQAGSLNKTQ